MIHLDVLKTVNSMPISDLELTESDILKILFYNYKKEQKE